MKNYMTVVSLSSNLKEKLNCHWFSRPFSIFVAQFSDQLYECG